MSKNTQTFKKRFPLHTYMKERRDEHAAITEFIEWAQDTGRLDVTDAQFESMLGDYFGVDPQEFQAEKDDMVEMIRQASPLGS